MSTKKKHPPINRERLERSERGQSLVELAVSFMLVMFVLAGAVDFGRAYFAVIALRDAAQEGVIYASLNPDAETDIEDRIMESSSAPIDMSNIPRSDINLSWSDPAHKCAGFYDNGGTLESYSVTVAVEYDFQLSMPMIQNIFPGGILHLVIDDTHTILAPQCP
jgi:Flp pilus assembly protein TadG